MIFPEEYKVIGISDINDSNYNNKNIYFLSKYIIEMNEEKNQYKIVKVKHSGKEILRKIKSKKIISNNDDIFFLKKK